MSYARRLYEAGFDLVAIQQNLGHADVKTTLGYIGELDAEKRRPPAIYAFDLKSLNTETRFNTQLFYHASDCVGQHSPAP